MDPRLDALLQVCAVGTLQAFQDVTWPVFIICAGWMGIGILFGRWWRSKAVPVEYMIDAQGADVDTEEETPPHRPGDGRHL